jgi:hypothetical protein
MLRERQLEKSLPALKECLDHCQKSPVPLKTLHHYFEGLRRRSDWSDPEVEDLERTARRTLRAILERSNPRT